MEINPAVTILVRSSAAAAGWSLTLNSWEIGFWRRSVQISSEIKWKSAVFTPAWSAFFFPSNYGTSYAGRHDKILWCQGMSLSFRKDDTLCTTECGELFAYEERLYYMLMCRGMNLSSLSPQYQCEQYNVPAGSCATACFFALLRVCVCLPMLRYALHVCMYVG